MMPLSKMINAFLLKKKKKKKRGLEVFVSQVMFYKPSVTTRWV